MMQQVSIPRLRPVIRVFVSSTFSDMKHERNALEADAFPKLEQLCQRHGFQFQAIDLRWGVSTEAGLDHRTMRICFDELRRAQEISPRPNFLILLGNRYGWRPLPEEISVKEFHTLEHAAAQIPNSVDKSAIAVLREWYREDTNAVPPVYLLQSRRQDLGDDQDYTHDAVWNRVQAVLWTIINRAMPPEQLQRRFDGAAPDGSPPTIVRFQASATEQEIWHGALRVPDAREHVLAFFREIENLAAFSDPKQIKDFVNVALFGVPLSDGQGLGVPRSRGSEPPEGGIPNAEFQTSVAWVVDERLGAEQARLKAELRQRLGSANVFRNEAPVRLVEAQDNQGGRTADVTSGHLAQLCADVVSRLSEIIQGQIEEYWRNTAQASMDRAARELEIEQREYERFAKERGGEESFVGRQVELRAILDYVGSDSRWPLVIHGASGCGKTALLARASQEVAKTRKRIERFIGVTPRSSDLRSLLSSLCLELRQRNPHADALPTEIKELRDEFSQGLQAATPEQPLILFLDALDQLADLDNGRLLNWLPWGQLPPHVKLVVSCLSDRGADPAGQPWVELEKRRLPAENKISLDAFTQFQAWRLLFKRWLPQAGRTANRDRKNRIWHCLKSKECRQPIFLKLLFEEVQLWHSYDPAPMPGESVAALLGQLFDRLSQPTNHGPLLVNRVLGYLSASRHGLAESEILEILFADPEYRAKLNEATEQTRHELPPNAKRIPIALWSRLRFDLAPYLTERAASGANVLTFYHRQVGEAVVERYLAEESAVETRHRALAHYFEGQPLIGHQSGETPLPNLRKLSELHYQLIKGADLPGLARLLRTDYLHVKAEAFDEADALVDAKESAETFARAENAGRSAAPARAAEGHWDNLVRAAHLYCDFAERFQASPQSMEALIARGQARKALAGIESEADPARRGLLWLAASIFVAEAGGEAEAAACRRHALPLLDSVLQFQERKLPLDEQMRRYCLASGLMRNRCNGDGRDMPFPIPPADRFPRLIVTLAREQATPPPRARLRDLVLAHRCSDRLNKHVLVGTVLGLVGFSCLGWVVKRAVGPATDGVVRLCVGIVALGIAFCLANIFLMYRKRSQLAPAAQRLIEASLSFPGEAPGRGLVRALQYQAMVGVIALDGPQHVLHVPALCRRLEQQVAQCRSRPELLELVYAALSARDDVCDALAQGLRLRPPSDLADTLRDALSSPQRIGSPTQVFRLLLGVHTICPVPGLLGRALVHDLEVSGPTGEGGYTTAMGQQAADQYVIPLLQHLPPRLVAQALLAALDAGRARPGLDRIAFLKYLPWHLWQTHQIVRYAGGWRERLAWGLLYLPWYVPIGIGLVPGYLMLYSAFATTGVMEMMGWTGDPYGFRTARPTGFPELMDRVARAPRGDEEVIPLCPQEPAKRRIRESALAFAVLSGNYAHVAGGLFREPEVRTVLLRLLRGGLLEGRTDVVLSVMGNRPLLRAATRLPRNAMIGGRGRLTTDDHRRQLARVLPPQSAPASYAVHALVSGACVLAVIAAVNALSPRGVGGIPGWLLAWGIVNACWNTLARHASRPQEGLLRGAGFFLVGLLLATGVVLAAQFLAGRDPGHELLVGYVSPLILAGFVVPEFLARWRGADLLYPTTVDEWRHRASSVLRLVLWLSVMILAGQILA